MAERRDDIPEAADPPIVEDIMKKLITAAMVAVTLAGSLAVGTTSADADPWRRHHHRYNGGDAAAAAALGLMGGLIIGGMAAEASRDRYYDDEVVVRRPQRFYDYEDAPPPRRRHYTPRCRTLIKYDMYGRPYEYKDCDG